MAVDLGVGLIGTGLSLGLRHGIDCEGSRANSIAHQALGLVIGVFSLGLGILFLLQRGTIFA